MGNASGAFFAGLQITIGFGFTSASLVGALMANGRYRYILYSDDYSVFQK
jgi:hypothetical protein